MSNLSNEISNQPNSQNSQSAGLSEEDVARLLSERSADSRKTVVGKIAQSYNADNFGKHEREVAEQIFRMLLKDTEVSVRASMAEALKDSAEVPRDIVKQMAADDESVALPILQNSKALSEYDLMQIVEHKGELSRLMAIAQREEVPERVSGALVETGKSAVVSVLVQNEGAKISEQSYNTILTEHADQDDVVESLVARKALPAAVAQRMITMVSDDLAEKLRANTSLSEDQVQAQTEKAREMATLKIIQATPPPQEEQTEELAEQLAEDNKLSPSLILGALCRGNLAFFEMALSKLAGIPLKNVRMLIYDKNNLGFSRLYEKTGLPEGMMAATHLTLQVIKQLMDEGKKPGSQHFANEAIGHVLRLSKGQEIDNLSYIIALVRQQVQTK